MSVINTQPLAGASGNQGGAYNLERSLRFRSSASAYLNRTFGTPTNALKFTWSGWVKRGTLSGAASYAIASDNNSSSLSVLSFANDQILWQIGNGTNGYAITTTQVFRDPSAWYHIVAVADTANATSSNRLLLYINGVQVTAFASTSYPTQNFSSGFNSSGSAKNIGRVASGSQYFDGYMTEVNFIDGQALTPSSFGENDTITGVWKPKRYAGTYGTNGFYLPFSLNSTASYAGSFNGTNKYLSVASSNAIQFGTSNYTAEAWVLRTSQAKEEYVIGGSGNTFQWGLLTNGTMQVGQAGVAALTASTGTVPLNRWTHIAVVKNSGTLTYYINGVASGTATDSLNYSTGSSTVNIGTTNSNTGYCISGHLSNVRVVKGSAVYTSAFTPSTAPLTAITNTSLLTLQNATIIDNSTNNASITNTGTVVTSVVYPFTLNISADFSGNNNNWTPNNISLNAGVTYDSMTDVPTLTSATQSNYCVMNPLDKHPTVTTSNANLTIGSSGAGWLSIRGTIGMTTGKWYWEHTQISGGQIITGMGTAAAALANYPGSSTASYGYLNTNGNKYTNGTATAYGASWTNNDVIGFAFDADAGTLTYYKNGTSQGTAFTSIPAGTYFPMVGSDGTTSVAYNFGQRPFAYTPPTGFKALNTFNLPDSTIKAGNAYMDATLYTGTSSALTVTNAAGFKPDLVWAKNRGTGNNNVLGDFNRGVQKQLYSNSAEVEVTSAQGITSFNSNGFSVGTDNNWNNNTYAFVAWQWKANGSAVSNTAGSITSSVNVNPTAGFSIITYTGTGANATVGHGLGVAPKLVITKNRGTTDGWCIWHTGIPNTHFLQFSTAASTTLTAAWNSTSPTSSVFSVGTHGGTNGSSGSMVAYCWSEIEGFSKFGSYTGNGSTDGPFVYTGFRPKFIMIKRSSATEVWAIIDTARDANNVSYRRLLPNSSSAESTGDTTVLDALSNGFKLRSTDVTTNGSGSTYIYAAFAENPFKNSLAR